MFKSEKNQLLILGSDQGNCTMDNIYSFLRLPYNDKLFLGRHKEISSSYYIYFPLFQSRVFDNLYHFAPSTMRYIINRTKLNENRH